MSMPIDYNEMQAMIDKFDIHYCKMHFAEFKTFTFIICNMSTFKLALVKMPSTTDFASSKTINCSPLMPNIVNKFEQLPINCDFDVLLDHMENK